MIYFVTRKYLKFSFLFYGLLKNRGQPEEAPTQKKRGEVNSNRTFEIIKIFIIKYDLFIKNLHVEVFNKGVLGKSNIRTFCLAQL